MSHPLRAFTVSSALLALSLAAVSCTSKEPTPESAAKPAMTDADMVARGKYLTTIAGCGDCHTPGTFYGAPDMTRMLSGSEMGWTGPWGTTYARNLTPDAETGIGAWSEEDIVTAIRQGKRPDGTAILPPMPWPDFAHLTDEDAHSIAKFLKNIPAVSHKVPAALPPGSKPTGSFAVIPAPSAWDAPRTP